MSKTGKPACKDNFLADDVDVFYSKLKAVEDIASIGKDSRVKAYFAAPWFTPRGEMLYNTCKTIFGMYSDTWDVFFPRDADNKTPLDAFRRNVEMIKDCDVVFALVAEKDVGTAWEIGMAYALDKDIILIGYDESSFLSHTNVMLAFTGSAITLEKLPYHLNRHYDPSESDYVDIPNTWEGKE